MRIRLVVALAALVLAACDPSAVSPTPTTVEPNAVEPTTAPPSVDAGLANVTGPWRSTPVQLEPSLVTAIEFVCKNQADPALKASIEDVPVALVDARGDSLVSLILADEHRAFECRVKVENLGGVPTTTILVPPTRLDPAATLPTEDGSIRVINHNRVDEDTGARTILIGRVGSGAPGVIVGFQDGSEIEAAVADGWYAAWWPDVNEPSSIAAVDGKNVAIADVPEPGTEVQGRVGPASWWVDPAALPLSPDATSIPALIQEQQCASGKPPEGRVTEPVVLTSPDAILVNVWVRIPQGGQDCQGNPAFPIEISLPDPLGERQLLDGSEVPPRDATEPLN